MKVAVVEPCGAIVKTASLGYLFSTFTVLAPRPGFLTRLPLPSCRLASGVPAGTNDASLYGWAGSAVARSLIAKRTPSAVGDVKILEAAEEPPQISLSTAACIVSDMSSLSDSSMLISRAWTSRTAVGGVSRLWGVMAGVKAGRGR